MGRFTFIATFTLILCALCAATTHADTLIFNNSNFSGYAFNAGSYVEILDYGTSSGGRVSKFVFDYVTDSSTVGTIWVRFYRWTDFYDPGYTIKSFALTNVPSTGGYIDTYEYVIPEADRFELPSGEFGYSFEFSRSTTKVALALGGTGSDSYYWEWVDFYDDWWLYQIGGVSGNGFSMKVYTAPPVDEVTCDIAGSKFDDLNGNGIWESNEPDIPGWEVYIDENGDGVYQQSEPNVVTDPNGMYFFENLDAPATYTIREVMQDGWNQTLPGAAADDKYVLAAEPNTLYTNFDFGNTTQPIFSASISGMKFQDSNANSTYDIGEPGLSNWRIYIDANGNGEFDAGELNAITNASGDYQLTVSAPGTYIVAEEMKDGWVQTYPTDACTYSIIVDADGQMIQDIDFGNYTFYEYGGGSGTEADPYLISSSLHLQAIGAHKWDWDKHFKLTKSIALTKYKGSEFNLIGRYNFNDESTPFSGTFDGNGLYIGRFSYHYTDTHQEFIGLFGYVNGAAAHIKNLTMYDTTINTQGSGVDSGALIGWLRSGTVTNCYIGSGSVHTDQFSAGGLVGDCDDSTIIDCHARIDVETPMGSAGGLVGSSKNVTIMDCSAEGTVTGYMGVGGLVGENSGQITRCYADADVTGFQYVGGLVGESSGTLSQCYAEGTVQTVEDYQFGLDGNQAGGLLGRNGSGGQVDDCYASSSVTGHHTIGGLIGISSGTSGTCYVTNSYATGLVSGLSSAGGLIGTNSSSIVTGCVWDKQTTGRSTSAAGTGKTTWQMQNEGTFSFMGWDLTTPVWNICPAAGYPVLAWQPCQAGPGGVTLKWSALEETARISSGVKVLTDANGNVIVASKGNVQHETEFNYDYLVTQYTASGEHRWTQTYDSDPAGDVSDTLIDMAIDDLGNIYLTGNSDEDILTVKYNSDGAFLWSQIFDGPEGRFSDRDEVVAIELDAAGNVYLAAKTEAYTTDKDFCLIKYNTNGVFQWYQLYDCGDGESDGLIDLAVDSLGYPYITGQGLHNSTGTVTTVKYDPVGNWQWSVDYEYPIDTRIYVTETCFDDSDNLYISGVIVDEITRDQDALLIKYNSIGEFLWSQTFDHANGFQNVYAMAVDDEGDVYLGGVDDSSANSDDYLVVKYSSDGQFLWYQTHNGDDNVEDGVTAMAVDSDNNVYVTGMSDFYREGFQVIGGRITTQKYNSEGNLIWSTGYIGYQGFIQVPESMTVSQSGNVYITGQFEGDWLLNNSGVLCYASCSYPGDANVDHKVTLEDFSVVAQNWLDTNCDECQKADWTGDGNVQLDDISVVASNWLNGI